MVLVLLYLIKVGWQHVRGRGVVLYDRHLLDAMVHLDFVYEGVDLSLHRALIQRALPRTALSIYLDVPVKVAMARKPEESEDVYCGEYSVRRQLEITKGTSMRSRASVGWTAVVRLKNSLRW